MKQQIVEYLTEKNIKFADESDLLQAMSDLLKEKESIIENLSGQITKYKC